MSGAEGPLGFVMLCHTALHRAAGVARHWAGQGCPVVIHVDRRVPAAEFAAMRDGLADLGHVRFARRYRCDWGMWNLVAATQTAAEQLLAGFPGVRHVFLASGACLPLRPVAELQAYLAAHPDTDFIESVTTEEVGWTVGGLSMERFTLRFPFAWRRQRRLFDAHVALQRALGLRRRIPEGLVPHLGSQWWCLTRTTLEAILQAPDRAAHDRWFRRVWIPDESYFQTLVRRVSRRVESRSLTLSRFDSQGRPHVFYDDHLDLLRRSDCFVARKIWPHAEALYRAFPVAGGDALREPDPSRIHRLFAKAAERRMKGRPGLHMQSRFPTGEGADLTAAPYSVFQGFAEVFEDFEGWLSRITGTRVHGHLFAPDRVDFADGARVFDGALSDSAALRDYNPRSFLTNLIWATRGERQCFQLGPGDVQAVMPLLAGDGNAQVSVVTGAWAVPLFRAGGDFAEVRRMAARLQQIESAQLALLRGPGVRARVRIWTLSEFLANPMEPLQAIIDEISPRSARRLTEAPRLVALEGFAAFLQELRNQGMQPVLTGDFPVGGPGAAAQDAPPRERPYLVT